MSKFIVDALELSPTNYERYFNFHGINQYPNVPLTTASSDGTTQRYIIVVDLDPYSDVVDYNFVIITSILARVGGLYAIAGLALSILFTKYATSQFMKSIAKVIVNDEKAG